MKKCFIFLKKLFCALVISAKIDQITHGITLKNRETIMGKNLVSFDWAMKRLLRSKANFGILEGFLSELLKQELKILNLLESESNKNDRNGKQNRVDVLVQLKNDEIVLIEVQVNTELDYLQRMLYGTSKIVSEYLHEGDAYKQVKKVYSVNILYFSLGHGKDYIYHGTTKFIGMHQQDELALTDTQKEIYKKESIYQIYPEYYLIKVNEFNNVAKDSLDEWIYFLKNEEIKDTFHAKGLREAKDKLSTLKLTDEEKLAYQRFIDDGHYQASMVESNYDKGLVEGKAEGETEGEKIGIEKGEKIGIEKGKAEGEKIGIEKGKAEGKKIGIEEGKIAIAKNMKSAGMSAELIKQVTGLEVDELR